MTTLLESGARPYRTKSGVIAAVALHGVLIAGAIVGTAKVVLPPPEKVEQHAILYVAPPPPAPLPVPPAPLPKVHLAPKPKVAPAPAPKAAIKRAPLPTPPQPKLAAVKTPTLTAAPKVDAPAAPVVAAVSAPAAPVVTSSGGDVAEPSSSSRDKGSDSKEAAASSSATSHSDGSAFTGEQVEREVRPLPGAPKPVYPTQLRENGISGRVVMRFVVGTDGRVEEGSFEVIDSPNKAFSDAVRKAILATRFQPAEVGGHAVRQLVEQSFTFAIQ